MDASYGMRPDRAAAALPKRALLGITILGGLGMVTAVLLTVVEGVKYRTRELAGLEPIPADDWVAALIIGGLVVFVLCVIAYACATAAACVSSSSRSEARSEH